MVKKSLHLLSVGKVNHVVLYLFVEVVVFLLQLLSFLVLNHKILRQNENLLHNFSPDLGSSIGCIWIFTELLWRSMGNHWPQGILYTICKGPFVLVWQVNAGFMGLASEWDTGFSTAGYFYLWKGAVDLLRSLCSHILCKQGLNRFGPFLESRHWCWIQWGKRLWTQWLCMLDLFKQSICTSPSVLNHCLICA